MRKILFVTLLLIPCILSFSQTDSIIYYVNETPDTTGDNEQTKMNIWFPEMNELKSMWKLNLVSLVNLSFSTAFESRIRKNIYYEIGILAPTVLWNTNEFGYIWSATGWLDFRFYHGFQRLKKKGKKAHSIFGNYVALGFTTYASNLYLDYENKPQKHDIEYNIKYVEKKELDNYPTLLLGSRHTKGYMIVPTIKYGIQRRLSDFGYIEAVAGFGVGKSFSNNKFYQNLTAQFNLGFDIGACYRKWIKK